MAQNRVYASRNERIDREPCQIMSFTEAFDAPAVKQHLESVRVSIPVSRKPAAEVEELTQLGQTQQLTDEIDTDPSAISAAYEDFLLIYADEFPQQNHEPPHPLFVLSEFLDAFGFIDYSGIVNVDKLARQAGIPMRKLNRVLRGNIPITSAMSKSLAEVFGTSPEYWNQLQRDYDLATRQEDE